MKAICLISCGVLILCFTCTGTFAATEVTYIGQHSQTWYVRSEEAVTSLYVSWSPPVDRERRHFRDEPGGGLEGGHELNMLPAVVDLDELVMRPVCWRLEEGESELFDWQLVALTLCCDFGVRIGESVTCQVGGVVEPIECSVAWVEVYVPYVADYYRVVQDGNVAVICVLEPCAGMALVYRNPQLLPYRLCAGASPAAISSLGTCASDTNPPFDGTVCSSGGNDKRQFHDEPIVSEGPETATWGKIKALYR